MGSFPAADIWLEVWYNPAMNLEIFERLCVECRFAPPDRHPAEMHCQWRFYCRA